MIFLLYYRPYANMSALTFPTWKLTKYVMYKEKKNWLTYFWPICILIWPNSGHFVPMLLLPDLASSKSRAIVKRWPAAGRATGSVAGAVTATTPSDPSATAASNLASWSTLTLPPIPSGYPASETGSVLVRLFPFSKTTNFLQNFTKIPIF